MFQVYNSGMFGVEINSTKFRIGDQVERGSSTSHDRRGRFARRTVSIFYLLNPNKIRLFFPHLLTTPPPI